MEQITDISAFCAEMKSKADEIKNNLLRSCLKAYIQEAGSVLATYEDDKSVNYSRPSYFNNRATRYAFTCEKINLFDRLHFSKDATADHTILEEVRSSVSTQIYARLPMQQWNSEMIADYLPKRVPEPLRKQLGDMFSPIAAQFRAKQAKSANL